MQDYLRSLLLVGAIAALAGLLLPEKNDRLRRLLEFGLSLLVLVAVCRPLAGGAPPSDFFGALQFPSADYVGEGLSPDTQAAMERAVGDGIVQDIATRYGIPPACIRAEVRLSLVGGELTVSSLTLTFSGEGRLLDLYAVRQYAARAYQTNCEVKTDGG